LTLHCAILYNPSDETSFPKYIALIKHLVSVLPESLEEKSSEGWTPLQIAVFAQREEVVSYLISIGANQRHRDRIGRNVVHTMVAFHRNSSKNNVEKLQRMIEGFDEEAVKEMLLERCNYSPGALTPLAYWMAKNGGAYCKADVVELLSRYSTGEDLEMINGEGDLPLHVVCCNSTLPFF